MLTRMYNIGMHARLPLTDVPWQWVVHWSQLLEKDLDDRRLQQRLNQSARNRRRFVPGRRR